MVFLGLLGWCSGSWAFVVGLDVAGFRVRDMVLSISACGDSGWVLHLERWDQGDLDLLLREAYEDSLLLDYDGRAILTKRPMSNV